MEAIRMMSFGSADWLSDRGWVAPMVHGVLAVLFVATLFVPACGGKKHAPTAPQISSSRSALETVDSLIAGWEARDTSLAASPLETLDYFEGGGCVDADGIYQIRVFSVLEVADYTPRLFVRGNAPHPPADAIVAEWLGPAEVDSMNPGRVLVARALRLRVTRGGVEDVFEGRQFFTLVRGDSAFLLPPGEPSKWYLEGWVESPIANSTCPDAPPYLITDLKAEYVSLGPRPPSEPAMPGASAAERVERARRLLKAGRARAARSAPSPAGAGAPARHR